MKIVKAIVYYIVCTMLKLASFIFFSCKAVGKENLPKNKSFLICPNHISWFDVVPLNMVHIKEKTYMGKKELFKNKIIGAILGFFGVFPVDRETCGKSALEYAKDKLSDNKPMIVFIEGTRTLKEDASPGRAKPGAVFLASQTGCDVVPVAIVYKHGRPRIFSKTTVYYGQPITTEQMHIEDGTSRSDLRRVSSEIMDRITEMWRDGTEKCRK